MSFVSTLFLTSCKLIGPDDIGFAELNLLTAISPPDIIVTTIAGSGLVGSTDATGSAASFNDPEGLCLDGSGNIYVTDTTGCRIRRITPAGVVTTFAGSGTPGNLNANGTAAQFNLPLGCALDSVGNLYISDYNSRKIRIINTRGDVTDFAGSGVSGNFDATGTAATFQNPSDIATDSAGNFYVPDGTGNRIRKITAAGVVTTLAGSGAAAFADGTGASASFDQLGGIAIDPAGNIYAADSLNRRIRKITPAGVVTTVAGTGSAGSTDGPGTTATFTLPLGIALDSNGNLYVNDTNAQKLRKIDPGGFVTTIAGSGVMGSTDGKGTAALLGGPYDLAIDSSGNLYSADHSTHKIRKITFRYLFR